MSGDRISPKHSRRKILRLTGLATGAAILPSACRSLQSDGNASGAADVRENPVAATTETPVPVPESTPAQPVAASNSSRVVIVHSEDRVAGTHRALDLLQPQGIQGQTVFLKPNYNTGDPAPAATNAELLEALIQDLQGAGASAMTVGDRSGMEDTRRAMQRKGAFELADRYGLKAIVFDEMDADQWQYFDAEGTHWQQGFAVARPVLDAGAVVSTCCLKTHRFGGHFTLSLKNTVGMVAKYVPGDPFNYMADLHSSPHQRLMIAEINAAYQPALVLVDGVEAFVNGGPEAGRTVQANILLAGTDRIAIDVVALGMLRSLGTTAEVAEGSVWNLEQIQRAVALGLGAGSSEQIELVAADAESQRLADNIRQWIS